MATLNIKNFPDRLYRRIKRRAARNGSSIAREVIHILNEAVIETPTVSLLELEGLGKEIWRKGLNDKDAADYVAEERDSWR